MITAAATWPRRVSGVLAALAGVSVATAALVLLEDHGGLEKTTSAPAAVRFAVEAPKATPKEQRPRRSKKAKASRARAAGPAAPSVGTAISLPDLGGGLDVGLAEGGLGDDAVANAADVVMTEETVDEPPRALERVAPVHPPRARKQGLEGAVTIALVIDETGAVVDPQITDATPPGVFDEAALAAVKKWRFAPARYKGAAVRVRRTLTFAFTLE